jgi:predicted O-methyltransferase YrrM
MTDLHRVLTFEPEMQRALTGYVRRWFAIEDDVLRQVRLNAVARGLPEAQIRPEEGQMLQFLASLIGARRVLEMGTLAGYSGIWLARALPPDGHLTTLERDPRHVQVAREHFALAGVADRVEIVEGPAEDSLAALADRDPFDMVFLDLDKSFYPAAAAWALDHVRPGGLFTAHNAFRSGGLITSQDPKNQALRYMIETLAQEARVTSTIIPVGDGLFAAMIH